MKQAAVYRVVLVLLVIVRLSMTLTNLNLTVISAGLGVAIFILGMHRLSKIFRWASLIFFILGILLLLVATPNLTIVCQAINDMLDIVTLLIVMQLFTIPIAVGHYRMAVESFVDNRLHQPKSIFLFVMIVTNILSSILSLGTVPIIFSILGETLRKRIPHYEEFSSKAITRAFILGTLWSPGAATIFLICSVTNVAWISLFIPSFLLSLLGLTISYFLERKSGLLNTVMAYHHSRPKVTHQKVELTNDKMRLLQIMFAVLGLLLLSFILIMLKIGSSMQAVTLSGIFIVSLWVLALSQKPTSRVEVRQNIRSFWHNGLFSGSSLAPFFVAVGTFSYAFEHSPLEETFAHTLSPFLSQIGWLVLIAIPIIIVAMALVGIHPLASIALFGKLVVAVHLPFSPVLIALSLNIGGAVAYMLSPFAGIILVVASILNVSAGSISIKWNWKFCAIFVTLGLGLAWLLTIF
ncbi:hypothetical protein ACLJJ6_04865 [Pediococcus siamensis]|uniref:hypothetical protein n=1 Tax=Pediococcus siamensis TaxID=381829 RepID=UPI0039A24186